MEIIAGTTDFYMEKDTAVAIGKFDGVHLGHRRLLEEILGRKKYGLAACVFTFDPTPAVLFGLSDGKELTTREEKRRLFERLGIDTLIEFPLTKETAATEPERFATEILAKQMNTRFVAAGEDLSFGKNGAGNAELLERMAPHLGFCVQTIEKIEVNGIEVSSTYIRKLVEEGRMEESEEMLGMPYTYDGLGKPERYRAALHRLQAVPRPAPCGLWGGQSQGRDHVHRGGAGPARGRAGRALCGAQRPADG